MVDCKAVQLWLVSRHGTRWPSPEDLSVFTDLYQIRDHIVSNYNNNSKLQTKHSHTLTTLIFKIQVFLDIAALCMKSLQCSEYLLKNNERKTLKLEVGIGCTFLLDLSQNLLADVLWRPIGSSGTTS